MKKRPAGEAGMRRCWVVLLEVQTTDQLELEAVEGVLANLADRYPSALYSTDRCAVQFLVEDADGPDAALADGVAIWRAAARQFPEGDLVRAEVKTPAELAAEYHEDPDGSVPVPADQRALAAAYEATRRLLRSSSPREAVSVLSALVRQLGGTTVRPRPGDERILDCDLSLGAGEPMVAAADPYSIARLDLEEVLPAATEDARRIVNLLRAASAASVPALVDLTDLDFELP
ncbi:MAG: hypothetical protein JO248_09350 [Acidimicrobiia bacterium]|nr:hypothetical protein [Acidimicrobiia bacterium]